MQIYQFKASLANDIIYVKRISDYSLFFYYMLYFKKSKMLFVSN